LLAYFSEYTYKTPGNCFSIPIAMAKGIVKTTIIDRAENILAQQRVINIALVKKNIC
jgi:hypothetical protein